MLGLRFCARASSSCSKWGPLFIAVRRPLTIVASLVAEHRPRRAGSVIVAHGPSCSAACGIFPDQGLNLCPLHWQADSQPLRHHGSPKISHFKVINSVAFRTFTCCTTITSSSKTVSSPPKETPYPLSSHFPFLPPPQPLATINLLSVSIDLPILNISYKWNHTIYGLLCLSAFT